MDSGWDTRASSAASYRNPDAAGVYHFPGWGIDALDWLLEERRITAIGVDTLSLDLGTQPCSTST